MEFKHAYGLTTSRIDQSKNDTHPSDFLGNESPCSANDNSQNDISANSWAKNKSLLKRSILHIKSQSRGGRGMNLALRKFPVSRHLRAEPIDKRAINSALLQKFAGLGSVPEIHNYVMTKMRKKPYLVLLILKTIDKNLKLAGIRLTASDTAIDLHELLDVVQVDALLRTSPVQVRKHLGRLFGVVPTDALSRAPALSKAPVPFKHPVVERCAGELARRGTKQTSINHTLRQKSRWFFQWLVSTMPAFRSFTINDVPIWKVTAEILLDYKAYLERLTREGRLAEITAKRTLQYVRQLFTLSYQLGLITSDVTRNLTNIKASEYFYRDIPSSAQLGHFNQVIRDYSWDREQDLLAFGLMLNQGFRLSEVATIRWTEVNFSTKTISVRGKRSRHDIVPMADATEELFRAYQSKAPITKHVFGNPTSFKRKVVERYKVYSFLADWTFPGGVHLLRHTFITSMSEHTTPAELLMLSRHDSLHTLSKYLHTDQRTLHAAINQMPFKWGG